MGRGQVGFVVVMNAFIALLLLVKFLPVFQQFVTDALTYSVCDDLCTIFIQLIVPMLAFCIMMTPAMYLSANR